MENITYRNRKKTVHDNRLLQTLKEKFEVDEIYGSAIKLPIHITNKTTKYLVGPLTDNLFEETECEANNENIIGLSWGFDLLFEIKENQLFEIAKNNLKFCRKVIVDNQQCQNILENLFKYEGQILNVPYGCDVKKFSKLSQKEICNNNIAVLRNWTNIHNNELILKALEIVGHQNLGTIFLAGEGNVKSSTCNQFKLRNPNMDIQISDHSEAAYSDVISKSAIYISASPVDGSSITLLEAMSASKIALVPDIDTNLEWIKNGVNGFTYKANNLDDLVKKIKEILVLKNEIRTEIKSNALKTALERANWEENKLKLLDFVSSS